MTTLKAKPFSNNRRLEKMQNDLTNPQPKKMLNCYIDLDLFKKFKSKTSTEGVSMTEVLVDAIIAYVEKG